MPYCEPDDVLIIVSTGLTPAQIGTLIALADSDLDGKLQSNTMSSSDKKLCSMLLTAILVASRDPQAYSMGFAKVQFGDRIDRWEEKVDELVKRASGSRAKIRSSSYQKIDEDKRYGE